MDSRYSQVGAGMRGAGITAAGAVGAVERRAIRPDLSLPGEWIFATPFGFTAPKTRLKIQLCGDHGNPPVPPCHGDPPVITPW